jgi:hypothetical protein
MTPAEIIAAARARGVEIAANSTGDGLTLRSNGEPPAEITGLVRNAKIEVVAHLKASHAPPPKPRLDDLLRSLEEGYGVVFRESGDFSDVILAAGKPVFLAALRRRRIAQ